MPRFENTFKQLKNLAPSLQFFALEHYDAADELLVASNTLSQPPYSGLPTNSHRKQEFLLGRYCLSRALAQIPNYTGEIWFGGNSLSGPPPCPDELLVSLSHCKRVSFAAVGLRKKSLDKNKIACDIQGIGVDIEESARSQREGLFQRITRDEERITLSAFFERNTSFSCLTPSLGILAFSAKEASFKALPRNVQKLLTISKISISFLECSDSSIRFLAKVDSDESQILLDGILVMEDGLLFALSLLKNNHAL